MKIRLAAFAIAFVVGLALSTAARAEVIFDNLNGGVYYTADL
jgi:hypothetical protein